jgi:excisionase family DNA binding protein
MVLSKREAAHLLGIDRGRTLGELLRSGQLRAVPWGRGERIPLEEVQRLAREGWAAAGEKPRPSHRRRKPRADPAALRRLDVDRLGGGRHG